MRHVDRRHRRRLVRHRPEDSTVADKVGFALFPNKEGVDNHGNWLWSWNLAIPASSKNAEAAKTFIELGDLDKAYTALVAEQGGLGRRRLRAPAPRSTRTPTTRPPPPSPARRSAAMNAADITKPTVDPVPYTGGQFVAIPEFQSIGTTVGQLFSAVIAGQSSVDDALAQAQSVTEREMKPRRILERSSQRLSRPASSGRPLSHPAVVRGPPEHRGRRHGHPTDPEHRPPDAAAVDRRAAALDDRAAGDDGLLLVPLLQPAEPRGRRLGRVRELQLLPDRPGVLAGDPQHALHRARRAR